jgi:hypothetical protein
VIRRARIIVAECLLHIGSVLFLPHLKCGKNTLPPTTAIGILPLPPYFTSSPLYRAEHFTRTDTNLTSRREHEEADLTSNFQPQPPSSISLPVNTPFLLTLFLSLDLVVVVPNQTDSPPTMSSFLESPLRTSTKCWRTARYFTRDQRKVSLLKCPLLLNPAQSVPLD